MDVTVTAEILQSNTFMQELLEIEVTEGMRIPVMAKLRAETVVFGVAIELLEFVDVRL